MSSENVTDSTFFERHAAGSVMWPAVPAVTIMVFVDTLGIIANFIVIFVTFRSNRLRSTANFFICLSCFFDSIHVFIHYYLAYVIYWGKNFDDIVDCLHKATLSLIGLNMGVALIVMTSFDRLFSVLFSHVHQRMNKVVYVNGVLLLCALYTAYMISISYINAAKNKNVKVVCLIVEAMHGDPATIWAASTCGSTLLAVINYAIVGICIKLKIGNSNTTQHLFKSLTIITMTMMCSWFLTCASMVFTASIGGTEEQIFYTPLYFGITINIACGGSFFILYKFSKEYRNSFQSEIAKFGLASAPAVHSHPQSKLQTRIKNKVSVAPISNLM